MFERFTDRGRRVVVLSEEEARQLKHNYIGTEHLLLGLLREGEGLAALALQSYGITLEDVAAHVRHIIGVGESRPVGHIPFTPRAKKVLELSLREGLQLGHNYIGTEHILLGLVREGEGVAAQILDREGVRLTGLRERVIKLIVSNAPKPPPKPDATEIVAIITTVIESMAQMNTTLMATVKALSELAERLR